jgi:ubiquinol-cytochrome c reductase core subunit 2
MLRASRVVSTSKRGFATVVDAASGFKVAAVDNGQPSSSVTVLLKAGSRYQSKPGVAHALSNFTFKVCLPLPSLTFLPSVCATRNRPV